MLVQSIDDLERQVAVAELELPAYEVAHHVDSAVLIRLEDLAGLVDKALLQAAADTADDERANLERLRGRIVSVLGRVVRLIH